MDSDSESESNSDSESESDSIVLSFNTAQLDDNSTIVLFNENNNNDIPLGQNSCSDSDTNYKVVKEVIVKKEVHDPSGKLVAREIFPYDSSEGEDLKPKADTFSEKNKLKSNPIYMQLDSRNRTSGYLSERIKILLGLLKTNPKSMFHSFMIDNQNSEVFSWYNEAREKLGGFEPKKSKIKTVLGMGYVAKKLTEFNELIETNNKDCPLKPKRDVPALKEFKELIKAVKQRIQDEREGAISSNNRPRMKNLGSQGKKRPKQEEMVLCRRRVNQYACPGCGHFFAQECSTRSEINKKNEIKEQEYQLELAKYDALPARIKPKKGPKQPEPEEMWIACMCTKMQCRNRRDGKGCDNCAELFKDGMRPPIKQGICTCEICKCQCTCYYTISQRPRIIRQKEMRQAAERFEKLKKKTLLKNYYNKQLWIVMGLLKT